MAGPPRVQGCGLGGASHYPFSHHFLGVSLARELAGGRNGPGPLPDSQQGPWALGPLGCGCHISVRGVAGSSHKEQAAGLPWALRKRASAGGLSGSLPAPACSCCCSAAYAPVSSPEALMGARGAGVSSGSPPPPHSPSCFSRGPRRKAGPQARVVCRPEGHSGDADPETLRFSLDGVPGGVGGTSPRVSQSSAFQGRRELPALLAPWPRSVLGSPRSHSFQTARSRDVRCSRGRGLRAPARGWRGRGPSRPRCRQLRGCRRATPLWARPTSLLRGTSGLTRPLLKSRRVLLND